ncbi:esterase OVCA2 [Ischnura elegans]|uniref:esterase OVCA2 n=1 Tax=Ischnura elegans TaxID=197161 RepID=UPI001ED88B79|nr:esterase OVCA2 [Ischnura elegans]
MLRILCIHGYRQNASIFREKTGSLRKMLKKIAEMVYITAPLQVSEDDFRNESGTVVDGRGWWFSGPNSYFKALDASDFCFGLEESIKIVEKAFKEEGPFDGILAFSQGAAFLAILCAMQQRKELQFNFNFAILIAGFKSRCSLHDIYYHETISLPTLHVYGETDAVIGKDMSVDLLLNFKNPAIICHGGGHYVPATGAQKQSYLEFLQARVDEKELHRKPSPNDEEDKS